MKCCEGGGRDTAVQSPPVRGALIEIYPVEKFVERQGSPPVRGALIEIAILRQRRKQREVAPREGGVD